MGDSFEGITVPEGEPGALRDTAAGLAGASGALHGMCGEIRAMPSAMGGWRGPSSVAFAGSCATQASAAFAAGDAMHQAAAAARHYASELEDAQRDARRAIDDARDARRRIIAAEQAIADAQAAQQAAATKAATATIEITATGLTGTPSASAQADLDAARTEAADAADRERRARRELEQARDDLDRAKRRGERAEERARDAARAASGAFGGLQPGFPAAGAPGAPAQAVPGVGGFDRSSPWYVFFHKPFNPFYPGHTTYDKDRVWWDYGNGVMVGGATFATKEFSKRWMRMEPGYWAREPKYVAPYLRRLPGGRGMTTVRGYMRPGEWVGAQAVPDEVARAQWAARSRWLGRGGAALAFGAAGLDQWVEDGKRSDLTTTDRVGRTAGATAFVGGVSIAGGMAGAAGGAEGGAALGGAIGTLIAPGPGTAIGGAIGGATGAIVGGVAGSGLAGAAAGAVKAPFVAAGQGLANGAVDTANAVADGVEGTVDGAKKKISEAFGSIHL